MTGYQFFADHFLWNRPDSLIALTKWGGVEVGVVSDNWTFFDLVAFHADIRILQVLSHAADNFVIETA